MIQIKDPERNLRQKQEQRGQIIRGTGTGYYIARPFAD